MWDTKEIEEYIYIYSFWWKLFFGQCDPLFPKWKCAERRIEKRGKGGGKTDGGDVD